MSTISLTSSQQLAISLCTNIANRIIGITGEAGTGKTIVLGHVALELISLNYHVALAAPTGRAARRIQEATGVPAITIHRMLRWSKPDDDDDEDQGLPAYTKHNPMPYDVILIDEAPMVSTELYRAIIDAMKKTCSIRFFGDANQLPPIKGKSPFLNILKKYDGAILTENFRSKSGIIQAARSILKGIVPQINDQFNLLNVGSGMGVTILEKFIDTSFITTSAQILCPTRVGKLGTTFINRYVQQKLNKNPRFISLTYTYDKTSDPRTIILRPGDKIIWTQNDYNLNLFNGMIGYIVEFEDEHGDIIVNFGGDDIIIPPMIQNYDKQHRRTYTYDPRKNIDLAYAITTHKAQGSEFDKVIFLLYRNRVLNRANFYTGVTRTKKYITVIAAHGGLTCAMKRATIQE